MSAVDYSGRPSVCRSCGALVGAGESACAQCGAPLVQVASQNAARRPAYDSETMSFARAVFARPAPFTIIFLVANILIFLLMTLSGGAENPATIMGYGAKVNSLINERGEWWRFVTPIFLHGGWLHLLFNMYGLWVIGPHVEKLYGSARFVVFWVLTGIAGVFASYLSVRPDMSVGWLGKFLFKAGDPFSMGASGALFGLIGVLFVFGLKFRSELPEGFKKAFGTGMLPVIIINLFIGFLGRSFIDNAAHLGGLVAGAALALVVGYERPGQQSSIVSLFWRILQAASLALVVFSFYMVWRHYDGPPLTLSAASLQRGITGGAPNVNGYITSVNNGDKALAQYFANGDTSGIDPTLTAISNASSFDKRADALLAELKSLLERAKSLNVKPGQSVSPEIVTQHKQLLSDYKAWQQKNKQWAETEGQRYGIVWSADTTPDKDDESDK